MSWASVLFLLNDGTKTSNHKYKLSSMCHDCYYNSLTEESFAIPFVYINHKLYVSEQSDHNLALSEESGAKNNFYEVKNIILTK